MKKLDDIPLEDIKSFDILDKKLIIYTEDEKLEYIYPTNLELLRRISYFIHRYRVESSAKANESMINLDAEKTVAVDRTNESISKASDNIFKATLTAFFFTCMFGATPFILVIYFSYIAINFLIPTIKFIKEFKEFRGKCFLQVYNSFNTQNKYMAYGILKEKSLEFIMSLDQDLIKNVKNNIRPENSFIENMRIAERNITDFLEDVPYVYENEGFQKKLGDYPNQ